MKHHKGKEKEEIQKNSVTKTCRKGHFFLKKKTSTNKETGQKSEIFLDKKTEKRDFHAFTESCRQRKNTKRSVNEKRRKRLRKKALHKKEKTQGWKNIRKTMKKADFLRRRIFLIHKTFFKKKRDKSGYKKDFSKH